MSFYQIERSLSNIFTQAVNNPELLTRHAEWWNYYKNAVFDIIIKWCDENRIHYEEQSKT